MKQHKYIFCSRLCSVHEFNRLFPDDKDKKGFSEQKFSRVLCEGFAKNNLQITVFSKRPVTKRTAGKVILPAKTESVNGVFYYYSRVINIKWFDYLYTFFSSFFWFLSPRNTCKNDVVLYSPFSLFQSLGCLMACKLRRIKTIAIVTDLVKEYTFGDIIPSSFKNLSFWVQTNADGMVFLTEQMNNIANPKHRPYMVIEGFADKNMEDRQNNLQDKRHPQVVLYSGALYKHYGLDILVEGFMKADLKDAELHLYGDGPYVKDIIDYSKRDSRIKYCGIKENAVIVDEQIRATLLVNPRYTDAEYTKYSFPGKNVEYMISGTATLTTDLPGMPKEYYPYIYLLKDETPEGMASALTNILNQPASEIHSFGLKSKKWMIENKSNSSQVKRLVDFIQKNFKN